MHLFDLPAEIRLKIYSELLVLEESIPLVLEYSTPPLRAVRRRQKGDGLCPAVLRLNKQVHDEASPVLYSQNVFRFPSFMKNLGSRDIVHTGVFLGQIGHNASLIRHITLPCPPTAVERDASGFFQLPEGFIRNLELMRDACTSLSTLQLTMPMYLNIVFSQWPVAANLLDALEPHLKAISSLETVLIDLLLFDKARNPSVDVDKASLLKNIRARGWKVRVTYAPSPHG
ncbi:hypothetical protein NKR19_g2579 [Coniochaeta hoffmannii]|uniref:F-box domain-containing protein n=1 Tax=Coniochaeta hoffmannii TaxID=91930 RepID=A0AA38VS32_9PEZI|nr:hypothetical protein NKR19_g2579 [Coniochaeta hoffmannii]